MASQGGCHISRDDVVHDMAVDIGEAVVAAGVGRFGSVRLLVFGQRNGRYANNCQEKKPPGGFHAVAPNHA
jgi:hypothetical protein